MSFIFPREWADSVKAERVEALRPFGFTERQARFLLLVMRHSGVCIKRQYGAFARIARGGQKCNAFFDKLVQRGYAVASDCIHNRAQLYHVHHKPLYYGIGEPESRYRRGVPARQTEERLMRLDAALISPDLDWLTTRSEKLAYLAIKTGSEPAEPPAQSPVHEQRDLFPGTFPIGVDATDRAVLIYIATKPWTDDFRTFLVGHLRLLAVTPMWTVRVVFPPSLQRVLPDFQRAFHDELESRLDEQTVNDLQWYFFHCRRKTDWSTYTSDVVKERFRECANAFRGPRFARLYDRWLREGETVLTAIPAVIREASTSGRAGLDLHLLPHSYDHLAPLVSRGHSRRQVITADAKEGDEPRRSLNPSLNPAP